jgi:hypothetical protein
LTYFFSFYRFLAPEMTKLPCASPFRRRHAHSSEGTEQRSRCCGRGPSHAQSFLSSNEALTPLPLLVQCTASPLPFSWPIVRIAGGHQPLRNDFFHALLHPILMFVVFPGVFSCSDPMFCPFSLLRYWIKVGFLLYPSGVDL